MRVCPSCGEENSDRARFCQSCATALEAAEAPAADTRKVVTIVFADVTGSTALGERLDPEALRRVMGRYFDEMAAVIERHGGTVEKFIGDAVMAVFGIPRLHEDDALRAVRAAGEMQIALEALNAELEREHAVGLLARIGVNTGEVVAGDPSGGQRLVTGDAVNVAARLEQAASPGEVLLGESTFRLVRDAVEVEPVEPLELKGKTEPVPAFRLRRVLEDTAGHERHLDSPMVGRAKELEMLERALERVVSERTSNLFTLLGPAGVGKSRLVQEFLAGPASSATVLRGRCLSYGEGITFFPLAEVVQQAAGIEQSDDIATASSKLTSLAAGADDAERIVSLVAGILAWGEPVQAEEAFWGVRKLFEHLASDRSLVVVFDDIHWAEPTFLDLVEHLADWTRDAALLLLCVARPELLEVRAGWAGGKLNATTILLEPLDGEAASTLVDNLLGRAEIPDTARARILEAAEGNPLFVEEMLAMLIDDGLLRFEDGAWRAVQDLADVTVPPTIQLLLAARLDRLDAEERAVIERGAVEGKVFHTGAVATLASDALRPKVPSRLLALARKELIRPDRAEFAGEDAFRFRHLLIRDAAYQAMPKEQRADLHERFAAWLEGVAGERHAEYAEILGHHLEQAYRYRTELGAVDDRTRALGARAADALRASSKRALEREDIEAARSLAERAVPMTEAGQRAQALLELAEILDEDQRFPEAAAAAAEALALAEAAGDRRLELGAKLILGAAVGQTDPTTTLAAEIAAAEQILAEMETLGDEDGKDKALLRLGALAFFVGDISRSIEIQRELAPHASRCSPRDRYRLTYWMGTTAYFGGRSAEEANEMAEEMRAIPGSSGLRTQIAISTFEMGMLGLAGRFDEAWRALERALQTWAELGNARPEAIPTGQAIGETYRLAGRLEDAERWFRDMVAYYDDVGETGFNSTICALLALTLCDLQRFDEAETFAMRSRELTAEDDFASQVAWRLTLARVLASRGGFDEAVTLAEEASTIVEATEYLVWQGDAHEVRGIVLSSAGRDDEAASAYHEAIDRYERKGAAPALGRVRVRLADLG
jgi:class 3 adenylate cyclase/tetratricopeptide (TPR) repeat protein